MTLEDKDMYSVVAYGIFIERVLVWSRALTWDAIQSKNPDALSMASDILDAISNVGMRFSQPSHFSQKFFLADLERFDSKYAHKPKFSHWNSEFKDASLVGLLEESALKARLATRDNTK